MSIYVDMSSLRAKLGCSQDNLFCKIRSNITQAEKEQIFHLGDDSINPEISQHVLRVRQDALIVELMQDIELQRFRLSSLPPGEPVCFVSQA